MILDHLPILVILTFLLAALLMPLAGALHKNLPWLLSVVASSLGAALSAVGLQRVLQDGAMSYAVGGWAPPIGIELVADPLSCFFGVTIGLIGALVLAHSRESVRRDVGENSVTFYASAMLLLGAFAGLVGTGDLFNVYVFLEISALAGYALLGAGSARAAVSAFRYLILGTIGASFYLIGLGFLFMQTGTLNMADIAAIYGESGLGYLGSFGAVMILVGVGVKMAMLPLHYWLPDAYSSAPSTSTALIAPLGTKVAAYLLIRLLYDVFPYQTIAEELRLFDLLAYLGAAGIVWGSVMAIPQNNMKRMLAYSSVAQIGYIALGIGLATPYGYIGAILHVINHACMKGCLFLVTANLEAKGKGVEISNLNASLRREMPLTSACFALAAISMIGLPPTAGFFSKWYLLLGCYEEGRWIFIVTILVSSLLNAVYFFRILEKMYLGGKDDEGSRGTSLYRPGWGFLAVPTAILALSVLVLGLSNALIVTHIIRPMLPGF